jgi:hypothetical protein
MSESFDRRRVGCDSFGYGTPGIRPNPQRWPCLARRLYFLPSAACPAILAAMSKLPSTIGQQIRATRETKGMTAELFAQALGVPSHRVSFWESGPPKLLDVTMLVRIARDLGVRFIIE